MMATLSADAVSLFPAVEGVQAHHVILCEGKLGVVGSHGRVHDGLRVRRVTQAQGVAEQMDEELVQIDPWAQGRRGKRV